MGNRKPSPRALGTQSSHPYCPINAVFGWTYYCTAHHTKSYVKSTDWAAERCDHDSHLRASRSNRLLTPNCHIALVTSVLSWAHLILGIICALALAIHWRVLQGRRLRRRPGALPVLRLPSEELDPDDDHPRSPEVT